MTARQHKGLDALTDYELTTLWQYLHRHIDRVPRRGTMCRVLRRVENERRIRRQRAIARKAWADQCAGVYDATFEGRPLGTMETLTTYEPARLRMPIKGLDR